MHALQIGFVELALVKGATLRKDLHLAEWSDPVETGRGIPSLSGWKPELEHMNLEFTPEEQAFR
ncbi:MAG: hypothetical protein V3R15_05315, partial [Qipengyuania citrea]